MQKVDLVIAGVGAVALIATVLGIVFYEDAIGEQTVAFQEVTREGAFESKTGTSGQTVEWSAPDNATGATITVDAAATGTSVQASAVDVEVRITAPDGSTHVESGTISVPQGSIQSGTWRTQIEISHDWFDVPAPVNTTDRSSINETKSWTDPLRVTVTFTSTGGALENLSFAFSASGNARVFEMAPRELPDDPATA